MSLQLGEIAPDFTLESTEGAIDFHAWSGDQWVVFFSHPKDFTPVSDAEAAALFPQGLRTLKPYLRLVSPQ